MYDINDTTDAEITNVPAVGNMVRSYDFSSSTEHFIEGVVFRTEGSVAERSLALHIRVTRDVWDGEDAPSAQTSRVGGVVVRRMFTHMPRLLQSTVEIMF